MANFREEVGRVGVGGCRATAQLHCRDVRSAATMRLRAMASVARAAELAEDFTQLRSSTLPTAPSPATRQAAAALIPAVASPILVHFCFAAAPLPATTRLPMAA